MKIDRIEPPPRVRPPWPLVAAMALLLLSLLAFRPGVAMYDTVRQYGQVLTGGYDDWHPPVMAWLWSLLHPLGAGTAPMFVLQLAGYWLGFGLFARALGGVRALFVLLVAVSPMFLGWQIVILKDAQLVAALACAAGLVAHWRLRGERLPRPARLLVALCLLYALLLRANAAFTVIPFAAFLLPPGRARLRVAVILAGIPLAILVTQYASRHVFMAQDSGVSRTEAIYDLAAIAIRTGDATPGGAPAIDIAALEARNCLKPLFWDPLFARDDCVAPVAVLHTTPPGQLYRALARAILAHPLAYAGHRLAHLNSTLRWLVPRHWPLADPPAANEPNALGLDAPPGPATLAWQRLAGRMVETPLAWPVVWIVLALWALAHARALPSGPRRDLALALLASALCLEASFAVLSLSSDLRYHLWAMLAVALAWALLPLPPMRRSFVPLAALALILLTGLATRTTLPPASTDYGAMLQ
ncbi:MAG: hypothetical protein J7494_14155 [Sphingobium sp.]|nr:hypothetical protein [Sphingobium sp.]